MKTNLKKIKDCRYALSVEVDEKEVEACFHETFLEIGRKAKLPGFRPGKAPQPLIESTYQDTAKEEVAKTLVSRTYAEGLQKHQAKAISYPKVRDMVIERGKKMTFVAEFDVFPQIKLKKYRGMRLKRPSTQVKQEEVDRTLKSFQESRGKLVSLPSPRPVAEGDTVHCEVEVLRDGKSIQEKREMALPVKKVEGAESFLDKLIGANAGETKDIEGKENLVYRIQIKEIKVQELPPLDDAFAKSLGKSSLEELKEEIRKDLARYRQHQSQEKMKERLFDQLIKENSFALPDSLVERQKKHLMEEASKSGDMSGASPTHGGDGDAERKTADHATSERAERQVRLFFILEKIADEAKVEADEADFERRIQEVAASTQQSPDEIRQKHSDDIRNELRQNKTVDHLLAAAQVTEEEHPPSS